MSTSAPATTLRTREDLPPVGVVRDPRPTTREKVIFGAIGIVAAVAWFVIALQRGEHVSAAWFVMAAVGSYLLALRFYGRLIERKLHQQDDTRATPAEEFANGKDFLPTNRVVLFGHHFAAIAGAGPLVGPVLAAQMGYLPGTLWIVFGVIFAGAVQDYMVLHLSIRRRGRSLGQMAKDELGPIGGWFAILGVTSIMIILIAVLAIVIIGALASSPWGVFSIAMTIPIALLMGVYMRYIRPGAVGETSLIGIVLLVAAIAGGSWVSHHPTLAQAFTLTPVQLAYAIAIYGFFAAVLPVWLLLAPRDYLSTFLKIGTIIALAIGIPLGMLSASKPDSFRDGVGQVVGLAGLSIPAFLLGTALLAILASSFGFNPNGQAYATLFENPLLNLQQMLLPSIVLGFGIAAPIRESVRRTDLLAIVASVDAGSERLSELVRKRAG